MRCQDLFASLRWIVVLLVLVGNKLTCYSRKLTTIHRPRITTYDVKDYCENESFEAACASDEVIIMSTALYGRMQFGKCIDRDYGYVGCQTDVLIEADRRCSGLQKCDIAIPFQPFTDKATCPKDLKPYFKAGYQCLQVNTFGSVRCRSPDGIRLTGEHGYIASIVTHNSNAGSADCPWVIQAGEGQQINLTLHDFGTADLRPDTCAAYAIVREDAKVPPRSETICNGAERKRRAYLSDTSKVDIRVLGTSKDSSDKQFLIEYNDIKPTSSMRVQRRGNEATVQCAGSDAVWKLRCDGSKWVGSWGNCSDAVIGAVNQKASWGFISLPFGLSIAVIVIIALVIGTVFMSIGLMCLRCRRKSTEARAQQYKETQYYTGYNGAHIPKSYAKRELPWPPPPSDSEPTYAEENEYSYIAELPPPPAATAGGTSVGSVNFPEPPKYFEFDPNGEQVHVAANGERYVISGVVDGRGIMPNGAPVTRKDIEKRLGNKQVLKHYNRSNSSTGHDTYNPKLHSRMEERYTTDVGQNHVSI